MTIPALPDSLLQTTVSLYAADAMGPYGRTYGAAVEAVCYWEDGHRLAVDARGVETVATGFAVFQPDIVVSPGDLLALDSKMYEVIDVQRARPEGTVHHIEVFLGPTSAVPIEPDPTPVVITGMQWSAADGAAFVSFDATVELVSDLDAAYPEIEFYVTDGWYPATGELVNGTAFALWVSTFEDTPDLTGCVWRMLTQPAGITTTLAVPQTGVVTAEA
jgi:hypothetical protein